MSRTPTWAALSLHFSEESIEDHVLVEALRDVLGPDAEIFIPSLTVKGKRKEYRYTLYDGYVFVKDCPDLSKALGCSYVSEILPGVRGSFLTVYESEIENMKAKLQEMLPTGFKKGQRVAMVEGLYKGLSGDVMEVRKSAQGEDLVVKVKMPMGSLTREALIPSMFCEGVDAE